MNFEKLFHKTIYFLMICIEAITARYIFCFYSSYLSFLDNRITLLRSHSTSFYLQVTLSAEITIPLSQPRSLSTAINFALLAARLSLYFLLSLIRGRRKKPHHKCIRSNLVSAPLWSHPVTRGPLRQSKGSLRCRSAHIFFRSAQRPGIVEC